MSERAVDLAVIAIYLLGVTWFGAQFRKSQKSLRDYFLGGKSSPWWAIGLSIVAAETSTLTIIGTPALAFGGDMRFLQLAAGYLLARLIISAVFIPAYFKGQLYTAYELMERRFNPALRRFTSATFLVTRALAEGVRVYAISIVVSIILGTGDLPAIIIISVLTLFYTFEGGMLAVIWTDVVQMVLYVGGALLAFWMILENVDGGWTTVATMASEAGKFRILDFRFSATPEFFQETYSFWGGVLGGCFLATATHGTDQLVVQRLLSAKSLAESRLALISSWIVVMFQFTLFLLIGVMLWVLHEQKGMTPPSALDRVYPEFVWEFMPPVVAGIVMASILAAAMSNLSAALNSLASATVMDFFYRGDDDSPGADAQKLRLSRIVTVIWGVVLIIIAIAARNSESVLEAGLSIASVPLGALLGIFTLGVLSRVANTKGAITGMAAGFTVILYVSLGTQIAWTWYVVIGTLTTIIVGWSISALTGGDIRQLSQD